jgi:hypothetical protein
MKNRSIIFIILFLGLVVNIYGQTYPGIAGIHYSTGFTIGKTQDFITDYSWRGFGIEYKKFLSRNLTGGFVTGWNIYDQLLYDATLDLEGSTISGTQIRYFNTFPVMALFDYYMGNKRSSVRPYFGVAIGTYYIIQRLQIGIYQVEKDNWHFGLAPEVGILVPTDYIYLQFSVKYNYAFAVDNSIPKEPIDISYVSINLGISVPTM